MAQIPIPGSTSTPLPNASTNTTGTTLPGQVSGTTNLPGRLTSGRIYTVFDTTSDVVTNQATYVTAGIFSGNSGTLSAVYSSSLQSTTSKTYYYDVMNTNTNIAESQFSVAYGNRLGSGSYDDGIANSPSKAIYSQYKLLLLNPSDTAFTFANGTSSDSIYVINFSRARLKDKLDPANWQVNLAQLSGSFYANNEHTGSNVKIAVGGNTISLIDDSSIVASTTLTPAGRVYNVVSGSINAGVYNSSAPHYYGLAYPDMGMIVLNANMLDVSASFNTVTGSNIPGDNSWKLFTSISGSIANGNLMTARNEEKISSTHYFVRLKNGEYNFSNNPSFTTGSLGDLAQPTFIGDPKTYVTTIGLYNENYELLAVAKLSQPVQKSFSSEALIKVKVDF